jgi:hypothetical protein
MARLAAAGGTLFVCPICFLSRDRDERTPLGNAALGGTVQRWE